MPFTFDVCVSRQTPDGIPVSEHVNDYVMLVNGSEKVYVQHGGIYRNGSEKLTGAQAPAWFWDSYRQITPATRKLVGLPLPEDTQAELEKSAANLLAQFDQLPAELKAQLAQHVLPQASRMPVEAPKTSDQYEDEDEDEPEDAPETLVDDLQPIRPSFWTCGTCGVDVELKKKGVHMARLKRLGHC